MECPSALPMHSLLTCYFSASSWGRALVSKVKLQPMGSSRDGHMQSPIPSSPAGLLHAAVLDTLASHFVCVWAVEVREREPRIILQCV